jgi:GNAT superfamily N-acetyltransferase
MKDLSGAHRGSRSTRRDARAVQGESSVMNIFVRPYSEADFDVVTSIWLDSWKSTGVVTSASVTLSTLRERLPQEIARGWLIYVATLGSDVVGFLALLGDELVQLFIAPKAQNIGVGKKLLDFMKDTRPNGFHLTTAVQSGAGKFYERERLRRGAVSIHPTLGHRIVRYDWRPQIHNASLPSA